MFRDRAWWFALGAIVSVAMAARLLLVFAGPDTESDAYAHHVIARRVILEPWNPQVHWVWLPLFHWLSALAVRLGGTMDTVRFANAIGSAVAAVAVAFQVQWARDHGATRTSDGLEIPWVPCLAGTLVAWHPWLNVIGATAQNEALFLALLSLLPTALARDESRDASLTRAHEFARARTWCAALLVTALAMLRYEGWAVLLGLGIGAISPWRSRLFGPAPWLRAALILAPAAVVLLAWSYLRVRSGEAPFAYLHGTHQFVQDARHDHLTLVEAARKLPYYVVQLPYMSFGIPFVFAVIGIVPLARTLGPAFVVPYVACLVFVSATWMVGGQLGLLRHFVSVVPLFAAAMALGVAQVSQLLRDARFGIGLGAIVMGIEGKKLYDSVAHERAVVASAWPDRSAVVQAVRALPKGSRVVCDEPTIEVLAGLPLEDTKRWVASDPHFEEWVNDYARGGPVWLAIVRSRLVNPGAFGSPIVTSQDGRYALFRVEAKP